MVHAPEIAETGSDVAERQPDAIQEAVSPPTASPVPPRVNISLLINAVVFAILLTAGNLWLMDLMLARRGVYMSAPEVVTINAGDMLLGFVARNAPDISEDELRRRTRALNKDLEAAVTAVAAQNNMIVVNAGSVLAGTRDVTPLVLDAMRGSTAFGGDP